MRVIEFTEIVVVVVVGHIGKIVVEVLRCDWYKILMIISIVTIKLKMTPKVIMKSEQF